MNGSPLPALDGSSCALLLAGAGSKGAFEAGAVSELLARGHRFRTLVGASAGALNAALLASAIRAGREAEVAQDLPRLWQDRATIGAFLQPSVRGILGRRGLSGEDRIVEILERSAAPFLPGAQQPVRLVMVTASLSGVRTEVGGRTATTFEHPVSFSGADFDDKRSRNAVWRAATASAAVPLVFVPVSLPGVGPCADGGLVNNTPLKYALEDPDVVRVFCIVPYPSPLSPPAPRRGLDLLAHFLDVLIQERLLRDLRDAVEVNQTLDALDGLVATLGADAVSQVRAALRLGRRRRVELVQIRPPQTLEGNAASGFTHAALRAAEIDAGRQAVALALAQPRAAG